jgi:hypothetical protein
MTVISGEEWKLKLNGGNNTWVVFKYKLDVIGDGGARDERASIRNKIVGLFHPPLLRNRLAPMSR